MLRITPIEEKLFTELLEYNDKIGLDMTFRVAGGWVRDRLMGIPCDDIDIAIDRSSGAVFTAGFITHLHGKSEEVRGYHVIECNHEKSKHLETASLRYMDLSIDFVALRTEEYTDTRIPTVRTGTPQEDANRRDITINALFYNINTRAIEDYTERGLPDIKNKKIRTPLDPMETFLDDPLRILRVLRFASRLSFEIVPEILSVLNKPSLHDKLNRVVSKERVGCEIKKTLSHTGYITAIKTMAQYRIVHALFPDVNLSFEDVCAFTDTLSVLQGITDHPCTAIPSEEVYILRIFILLQNNLHIKKGKGTLTEYVIKELLKWTKIEREKIVQIERSLLKIDGLMGITCPENDWLVRVSRELGPHIEHSFTLYDIIQKLKKQEKINVLSVYSKILSNGYKNIYLEKGPVECSVILEALNIKKQDVSKYMERSTQLSIIHQTKDTEYILTLLKKEFSIPQDT
ncbi:hypothetical protein NEPAR05_1628 [Nematocida parisii]|uniref:tRNA-nucleotidyltransferase n=1 Tax=Nematocida parisii (strain ERTm3) TaxID=935791 RepID=I3EH80_NEMP3|nr:tRNA-nucleotidyltransferase [Nematocida parisii ERTm3]KAI5145320.1 hypothetical protein NEPAR07_1603 [Nematocida parisii]KAI5157829.1 hypothetical protein NEPAR05_1628 [Nematocida parisii]